MDKETSRQQHTLMGTDDAMVWAEEFCRIFDGKEVSTHEFADGTVVVDPGLMVGWFANAMQVAIDLHAGREAARQPNVAPQRSIEHPEDWDDEQFRSPPNDDIIDLVEALQRDEEEARAREDEFVRGFDEGRVPNPYDHIDPYGDTP